MDNETITNRDGSAVRHQALPGAEPECRGACQIYPPGRYSLLQPHLTMRNDSWNQTIFGGIYFTH